MFTTIFVQPLFNILFALYGLLPGHDFGVAVILLTFLVRLAIWPLVTRQLHSQKKVQALAPEIAKVREKAGGDRQLETQMMMELYKEKGTSPLAPILPLLVQLPIFFAIYIVFVDAVHPDRIAALTYSFVEQIPAVASAIANPSSFHPYLFGVIDLTHPSWFLALTAAAAQFYQSKMLQPKGAAASTDPQARMMQNIIYVFPVITFGVGLTLPSALALYWTVTSLVACYQQYRVLLRDAHEMEEVGETGVSKITTRTIAAGEPAAPAKAKKARKKSGKKGRK